MKYCVVKDTVTVIDGSENTSDVMLQNAVSAGFTESEVEILTQEQYDARVALVPVPVQPPTAEERLAELEAENVMNMLALVELHGLIIAGGGN